MTSSNVVLHILGEKHLPSIEMPGTRVVRTAEERRSAFKETRNAIWIALHAAQMRDLVDFSTGGQTASGLLLLEEVSSTRAAFLGGFFDRIVAKRRGVRFLPTDELLEVLTDENRTDYFIGGLFDPEDQALILYRGDLRTQVVPMPWFHRPTGTKPNPEDFEVIDYGQTIRLGDYEASTDAILYNFDAAYRKRAKKRQVEQDDSVGGCIRRLRLERGLGQGDFFGIPARTIRRIERNEVKKPQSKTLEKIAERLGVKSDELRSW